MNILSIIEDFTNNVQVKFLVVWLVTVFLLIAGVQWLKDKIAFFLMKFYEFIIQRNEIKL